tara:strand:- start:665 stop:799 length:135 start_codon:yes stop_codon:yes gene_type:complete
LAIIFGDLVKKIALYIIVSKPERPAAYVCPLPFWTRYKKTALSV